MSIKLETERLILRPYQLDQAERVVELAGDEAIAQTTFVPHPYTKEVAEEWIQSHQDWIKNQTAFPLAMMTKDTDELTGTMTLRVNEKHQKGELAYWVGKPYWNKGYASEAAKALVKYAFEQLNLNRVWAAAFPENPASAKVMQKAGLSYEGRLKQELFHRGKFRDIIVYGSIRSDYVSRETEKPPR